MHARAYAPHARLAEHLSAPAFPVRRHAKAVVAWMSAWVSARANAFAAAALYEHLSKLSDAQLHRRGLSRSTLARDVGGTFG